MLIQDEHVFGFRQSDNPGPYVADTWLDSAVNTVPTAERFREQIRGSLREAARAALLLEAMREQLDVPALLTLLADRPEPPWLDGRDHLAERACARLAELQDPEVLSRALPLAKGCYGTSILQRGFGTPKGRDYLLAKLADAKELLEARVHFASALGNAGEVYRSTLTEIDAPGWRAVGEADEGNSGYLTRIAQAARASTRHEELCARLVECIDHFGRGIALDQSAEMTADLRGALAALKDLYDAGPSEHLRFAIEAATAGADPRAYVRLRSPCGDLISILKPADPNQHSEPEGRGLVFEYSYTATLLGRGAEVRPSVVLVRQGSQQRVVRDPGIRLRGASHGGGGGVVVLPKDLPAGRYRVFFQVTDGGKVTSTGHHFLADL